MKDMYIPDGFNIITEPCESHTSYEEMLLCPDCIEQALRLNRLAHESATADLRRSEGLERPYESEDSRPGVQGYNIADGLSEAIMLGLSPSWVKEEDDSVYSHNLHNTLKYCRKCNMWGPQPDEECPECSASTKWSNAMLNKWCLLSTMPDDEALFTGAHCPIGNHTHWTPSNRPFIS